MTSKLIAAMLVVSNTSPLSNLAIIGRLDLVREQLGALGLLRKAKQTGRIPSLKDQFNRLRAEAHFFISPALEKSLLHSGTRPIIDRHSRGLG